MAETKTKIRRSKIAIFLNTGTSGTETWSLIGDGVTEQTISYNPNVSEETYVHQDSATSDVESYKLNIPTPMTAISGDPVFEYVDDIRIKRKVLADARTQCLIVYLYKTETSGKYPAEKNECSVSVEDFGGAGGEAAKINFTLNLIGDPVAGQFDPSSKTFTEDSEIA